MDSTKLLPTELSKIVAKCGVLRDFQNKCVGSMKQDFLEVGILRFPDIDKPYIQVNFNQGMYQICSKTPFTLGVSYFSLGVGDL